MQEQPSHFFATCDLPRGSDSRPGKHGVWRACTQLPHRIIQIRLSCPPILMRTRSDDFHTPGEGYPYRPARPPCPAGAAARLMHVQDRAAAAEALVAATKVHVAHAADGKCASAHYAWLNAHV